MVLPYSDSMSPGAAGPVPTWSLVSLWTPSCGRCGGLARCSGQAGTVMGVGEGGQATVGTAQGAAITAVQVIVTAQGGAVGGDEQAQGSQGA